jgi:hypothetical protein
MITWELAVTSDFNQACIWASEGYEPYAVTSDSDGIKIWLKRVKG